MRILPLVILLFLSGCAGVVVYHSVPEDSPYYFEEVETAARTGPIHAEVVGNPTAGSTVEFRQTIRQLMSGEYNGVPIRFVDRASPERVEDLRVVVWVNPSTDRRNRNLCTYQGGFAWDRDPRRLDVAMALCKGPTMLSESSGVFFYFNVDPVTTNRFKTLIPTLTAALLPVRVIEEGREFETWY